jgi:hypothetical protein
MVENGYYMMSKVAAADFKKRHLFAIPREIWSGPTSISGSASDVSARLSPIHDLRHAPHEVNWVSGVGREWFVRRPRGFLLTLALQEQRRLGALRAQVSAEHDRLASRAARVCHVLASVPWR